jgi:hypothetical protein
MEQRAALFLLGMGKGLECLAYCVSSLLVGPTTSWVLCGRADDPIRKGPSPIRFEEVAARAGTSFRFHNGSRGKRDLSEIMGGGVALFDADGDEKAGEWAC